MTKITRRAVQHMITVGGLLQTAVKEFIVVTGLHSVAASLSVIV
jgi:hypothetical protein